MIGTDLWRMKKVLPSFQNVLHFSLLRNATMQCINAPLPQSFLGHNLLSFSASSLVLHVLSACFVCTNLECTTL
jgi:hypothetical protein